MLPASQYPVNISRLFWAAAIVLSAGCGFRSERPVHRDKIEVGTDAKGRVVYKKFDQLIDDYSGRGLATVTQYFDTTGRLLSEFGTDHPRLGKQYLYEIFYGDKMKVVNYFRWPRIDSSTLDVIPPAAFEEQKIYIDTASLLKLIRITKISSDHKTFVGRYFETFPAKSTSTVPVVRIRSYVFKMPVRNFIFDDKTRLVLKDLTVL